MTVVEEEVFEVPGLGRMIIRHHQPVYDTVVIPDRGAEMVVGPGPFSRVESRYSKIDLPATASNRHARRRAKALRRKR